MVAVLFPETGKCNNNNIIIVQLVIDTIWNRVICQFDASTFKTVFTLAALLLSLLLLF